MKLRLALILAALPLIPATAQKAPEAAAVTEEWPEAWFEIFKLAPGKQEEFVRRLAEADSASAAAGLPPTQLFFHENGADFDVILYKPAGPTLTPKQQAIVAAKLAELGVPSGPAYFVMLRELVAAHTDTKTIGPISADQWLKRLDKWRAENPMRAKMGK
jgi:hypothetical protein